MDKALFETRAISLFNKRKFVFYDELQKGGTLKKMTTGQYAGLIAFGALVGFGAFMIDSPSCTDGEVKTELVKLAALCDLIGVKIWSGVSLVLLVQGDELTDEATIGKCHLIRDRLTPFRQFTMRIGWNKMPVSANVFFVFSNSDKAFHFRTSVQEHCKHYSAFYNRLWVLPWGIDLAAKSVWAYQGFPAKWLKATDLETELFS
jgi:hypothetical protein